MVISIVLVVFCLRLYFLKISIQHERKILENGGREYGARNSQYLTVLHISFYLFASIESFVRHSVVDTVGTLGIFLLIFSMGMLYLVQSILGEIWTVKLMIAKNHRYNDHLLFRLVKHPNYYLNIIPELLGLVLLCHAWVTAIILSPFYAWVLICRIREEEYLLETVILPNKVI
ncbi:isoprenylcysteine carboxyl methyltransferase family protein [Streptococcus pneumoniae]